MKDVLELIVSKLVSKPDEIRISETISDTATILELRVASVDLGRVIGKQGRTAQALRTLLVAMSGRESRRVLLNVMEQ